MNSPDFELYIKPFHTKHIKKLETRNEYCEYLVSCLKQEIEQNKFKIEEHEEGLKDEFYNTSYICHWADIVDVEKERIQKEYEESEKRSGGVCGHDVVKYT